ncbi:MAG: class I SAM-dependent methyltransferase [Candidatus Hermodarchaeota archaeon]
MPNVWEEIYKKNEMLSIPAHPLIEKISELFLENEVERILDLGCGGGRHLIYLASKGFDVYGLDIAPTGLVHTLHVLSEKKLPAHLTFHDMYNLPYDNDYFDALISVQVIHHNKISNIHIVIQEIRRVLRTGGLVWITVPVSKDLIANKFEEIEPRTFIPLNGREKGLIHHYFTHEELVAVFSGFSTIELKVDKFNHYSLIAQKT